MDKIDFNQTGGFRLETETFDLMQKGYTIFSAFGEIVGKRAIIKGCKDIGNSVSDGVVYIDGELFNFKGGTKQTSVIIRENVQKTIFENGEEKDTYYTRWVEFGVGTNSILWSDLKRFNIHKGIHKEVRWVGAGVTNETLPDGWFIANGENGTDNIQGRGIIGYDPTQSEFDVIGKTGGEKTHALTIDELPSHTHGYKDTFYSEAGGSVSVPGNIGSGDTDYDNTGHQMSRTTDSSGAGQAHNNLSPFVVMVPIQYIEE